jgi:hypothetical protein
MCQKGVSPRGYMMESGVWNKESEKVSCFKDVIFFWCALESVGRNREDTCVERRS